MRGNTCRNKLLLLVLVGMLLVGCSRTSVSERTVIVEDVKGDVLITQDDKVSRINTRKKVKDQDCFDVSNDSSMELSFDGNKYVYVEALSNFILDIKGNIENHQTKIELRKGSLLVELKDVLHRDCNFVVETSKTKISSNDAIYRVHMEKEDGKVFTYINVFTGSVSVHAKEHIVVKKGYQVIVDEQSGEFVSAGTGVIQKNNYEGLPLETLMHLKEMKKYNKKLDDFTMNDLRCWMLAYEQFDVEVDFDTGHVTTEQETQKPNKEEVTPPKKEEQTPSKPETETKPQENQSTQAPSGSSKPQVSEPVDKPTTPPSSSEQPQTGDSDVAIPHEDFDKWKDGHDPFVYDVKYASTGGHPDDGYFGEWGKYFPTRKAADAWLVAERNNPNSEFARYFLIIHENVDGSARVRALK